MDNRNARYWNDKAARSVKAKKHLDYVSSKYADNIKVQIANTVLYDAKDLHRSIAAGTPRQSFLAMDTVTAIFYISSIRSSDKIAALNFASFKNPGGMFFKR